MLGVERPKGSARGGEDQRRDPLGRLANQALEERAVLGVDRKNLCTGTFRGGDQELAGGDDQLFVGNGYSNAALDARKDGVEGDRPVGGRDHDVRAALGGGHGKADSTVHDARRRGEFGAQTLCIVGASAGDDLGLKAPHLVEQFPDAPAGCKGDDAEAIGVARDDVEGLRSNRPGRAENRNLLRHGPRPFAARDRSTARFRAVNWDLTVDPRDSASAAEYVPSKRARRSRPRRRKYTSRSGPGRRHDRPGDCRHL